MRDPMAAATATARSQVAIDLGALGGTRTPSFRSVDSCAGIRTRSGPFVTSAASLPAVHVSPENRMPSVRVAPSVAPG
jgi:hypothetical protein